MYKHKNTLHNSIDRKERAYKIPVERSVIILGGYMLHKIGIWYYEVGWIIMSIISPILGFMIGEKKQKTKLFIGVVFFLLLGLLMSYFKEYC